MLIFIYLSVNTGLSPGSQDLVEFTNTYNLTYAYEDLSGRLHGGQTVYSTIRCTNGAGLQTTDVSSGVTITTDPPDHTAARITVITNPISHHPSKHSHQVYSDALTFGWTGFVDVSDIREYEVRSSLFS